MKSLVTLIMTCNHVHSRNNIEESIVMKKIPCVMMRGGTSRGAFLLAQDLPQEEKLGNDSNLLIVFYVQIMPDDFVMQLHRF